MLFRISTLLGGRAKAPGPSDWANGVPGARGCGPPRDSPMWNARLVAAASARRGRWLVTRAPVVAARAASGVGPREGHPDTNEEAGEHTRNELPPTELPHAAHLLSAVCAGTSARSAGRRTDAGAYSLADAGTTAQRERALVRASDLGQTHCRAAVPKQSPCSEVLRRGVGQGQA